MLDLGRCLVHSSLLLTSIHCIYLRMYVSSAIVLCYIVVYVSYSLLCTVRPTYVMGYVLLSEPIITYHIPRGASVETYQVNGVKLCSIEEIRQEGQRNVQTH